MEKDRFRAKLILGKEEKEVSGWDAFDIINKIYDHIEDAIESAKISTLDDFATSQMLYDWCHIDYEYPGDMHRFDRFDFTFSFGRLACTGWEEL